MSALKIRWEYIADWINTNNYKRIAEIGLSGGPTSKYLLKNCKLDYYLLVDPDPCGSFPYQEVKSYTQAIFVRLLSNQAIKLVGDGELDLVYIDADHSYNHTKEDIELWLPKVRKGGILCGHDYLSRDWPDVKKAVDEKFNNVNLELENVDYGHGKMSTHVWWVKI